MGVHMPPLTPSPRILNWPDLYTFQSEKIDQFLCSLCGMYSFQIKCP